MPLVRVKDDSKLLRDKSSGAILNNDEHTYKQIIAARQNQSKKDESLINEIEDLKSQIIEMRVLINQLIQK